MTKQEIIKKIIAENKEPDQNLCPILWLNYYDSKGNGVRKNVTNGVVVRQKDYEATGQKWPSRWEALRIEKESNTRGVLIYAPRTSLETYYMKNWKIDGQNVLEMATITIDGHRGGGARDWKYIDSNYCWMVPRIFLFEGDAHVYNADGNERHPEEMKTFNHYFVKIDCHYMQCMATNYAAAMEAKNFFNADTEIYPWNLRNYYKKMTRKPKKHNPMDDIANSEYEWPDLSDYPLSEMLDRQRYYVGTTAKNNKVVHCICVNGYIVIRNLERYCEHEDIFHNKRREYKSNKIK